VSAFSHSHSRCSHEKRVVVYQCKWPRDWDRNNVSSDVVGGIPRMEWVLWFMDMILLGLTTTAPQTRTWCPGHHPLDRPSLGSMSWSFTLPICMQTLKISLLIPQSLILLQFNRPITTNFLLFCHHTMPPSRTYRALSCQKWIQMPKSVLLARSKGVLFPPYLGTLLNTTQARLLLVSSDLAMFSRQSSTARIFRHPPSFLQMTPMHQRMAKAVLRPQATEGLRVGSSTIFQTSCHP